MLSMADNLPLDQLSVFLIQILKTCIITNKPYTVDFSTLVHELDRAMNNKTCLIY